MKILVVDDEMDICEILQYNLEVEGYEVVTANSAEEADAMINQKGATYPSLILLDVMMGQMSGFDLARKLKENPKTEHIPIIFITALDNEDNLVQGLNLGADDYISKPLSIKALKARVKAVLRRTHKSISNHNEEITTTKKNTISFPGLVVDLSSKTVTLDNSILQLTKLEFELLVLLLQNPGKVFSREDLLSHCWPKDVYVLDRTVDVNITRLRKKLGSFGSSIRTRIGYGYVFEQ